MKFILTSVGTRGDMEPFLAIGQLLKERGHQVICAFPEQFRSITDKAGLSFASLGSKFIDLLESNAGKDAMGAESNWKKILGTLKLAFRQGEANKELVFAQREIIDREKPDKVLYNGKAVYPIIWGIQNENRAIFISPIPYMHYIKGHAHVAFNGNYGEFINKASFKLTDFGMVTTTNIAQKWLKLKNRVKKKEIRFAINNNTALYTISPSLFPQAYEWGDRIKVVGYHESERVIDWEPDPSLEEFADQHKKILFVTFGSMTNAHPEKKTGIILEILEKHGIPAIINTASGGLVKPVEYNKDLFFFIHRIPYHWILPKVYGVIHHGGSGTTHLALKYGCASLIIPHIIDQFAWNNIVHKLGAGPKGIKISKLEEKKLEPKILDLFTNTFYKLKAEQIASSINAEDFKEELIRIIEKQG